MELDDAEEAEVVSATRGRPGGCHHGPQVGTGLTTGRPPSRRRAPNWWVGGRTFGGMVVAQALSAALQTVPAGLDVHSLHGYFLRPTRPGSQTVHSVEPGPRRAVVQHPGRGEHGGGQGDLPHDLLVPRSRGG